MRGSIVKIEKGDKFERLTVIGNVFNSDGPRMVECLCICGNKKNYRVTRLVSGSTKSCGCLQKEIIGDKFRTHGLTNHPLFKTHKQMIRRCENPKDKAYSNYGERGIKVCNEWKILENFIEWANKNGWKKNLTIERNDPNGNYEPENCRWATRKEQCRNIRTNTVINFEGNQVLLLDLADKFGIKVNTLRARMRRKGVDFLIESLKSALSVATVVSVDTDIRCIKFMLFDNDPAPPPNQAYSELHTTLPLVKPSSKLLLIVALAVSVAYSNLSKPIIFAVVLFPPPPNQPYVPLV